MADFMVHAPIRGVQYYLALSAKGKERVSSMPFGSAVDDPTHVFGTPLKTPQYFSGCSKEFLEKLTNGFQIKNASGYTEIRLAAENLLKRKF